MKVIILNGSPKARGNTATALREVEKTLNQQGIETDWIHVGNKDIRGCIACNGCWKSGLCAFDDIVNEISVKMRDADGLLVGSPEYFASPNGTLLALLDRLFYSNLHVDWSMKVGASVSIARRAGTTTTMDALNKYFLKTNMQTMRQLGLNMAFMIKSIRLGLEQFGSPKLQEKITETHYIR